MRVDCRLASGGAFGTGGGWDDGSEELLPNRERVSLILDAQGRPSHVFNAAGRGPRPWHLHDTWCMITAVE